MSIEWTGRTWNPTRGCSRVSPGCEHCYAETTAHRFSRPGMAYHGLVKLTKKGPRWNGRMRLEATKIGDPLRWRKPGLVFVNSMSDLFHPNLLNEQIAAVFGVMAGCPRQTFQVLTKHPERAFAWFQWAEKAAKGRFWGPTMAQMGADMYHRAGDEAATDTLWKAWSRSAGVRLPLPNVWIGTSAENQAYADERIPWLQRIPAAVRFVSLEPLLGPIELRGSGVPKPGNVWQECDCEQIDNRDVPCPVCEARGPLTGERGLQWVIVGGESGQGARPCALPWVDSIVRACRDAKVPCFVKQLGARPWEETGRVVLTHRKGGKVEEWPENLRVREFPRGGRHAA